MTDNSSSTTNQCPSCHETFSSYRAFMIHLNSCKGILTQNTSAPSHKRPPPILTLAQRADEIFKSIKRPHLSGDHVNIDRLSVNPSVARSTALLSRARIGIDGDDGVIDGSDNYCHGCEFDIEQEDAITSDKPNNSSNDRYKYRSGLNPPPGVKFGVHLQHVISSHRGVDLKLYDEIIDLIHLHATTHDTDFSNHKQIISQKRIEHDIIEAIQSWRSQTITTQCHFVRFIGCVCPCVTKFWSSLMDSTLLC